MSYPNLLYTDTGIPVIHRYIPYTELVHCGFLIKVGSRFENKHNNGIAHFIEHAVFKGTSKRNSSQVLNYIEKEGGEVNAFTTREKTCFYASALRQDAKKAIDLLSDIFFNAEFPEKELENEKKVIFEEIEMYDDTPEEAIYDEFYELLFKNHPLGFNILGTKDVLKKIKRDDLKKFIQSNYTEDNVVFSIAGNISEKEVLKYCNTYFKELPKSSHSLNSKPEINHFNLVKKEKDNTQLHCIMGLESYSKHNDKRVPLALINNILGGSAMSSILNMKVREKNGLVYAINSNFSSYQDSGTFTIYFACDEKSFEKCQKLIYTELNRLHKNGLTSSALSQYKKQMIGQMAIMQENNSFLMQNQARNYLDYNRFFSLKDNIDLINQVSLEDILEVSKEIFNIDKLNTLLYIPTK